MNQDFRKKLAQSIGRVAREARKALGLTQEDVAERIGISGEFYARMERGKALPSVPTLAGISRVLGVSADVLLGHTKRQRAAAQATRHVARPPEERPEVRRLVRRLRKAKRNTLLLVSRLLKVLERKR